MDQKIKATRSGDDVRVAVPLATGKLAVIDLPFDKVEAAGLALLQVANHYRLSLPASLFDAEPIAAPSNPRIELRAEGDGVTLVAIDSGFLGPLIAKLDANAARELRDGLTLLLVGWAK